MSFCNSCVKRAFIAAGCFLVLLAGGFAGSDIGDQCWRVDLGYKCIICEDSNHKINCSTQDVINLTEGFYGRMAPGSRYCKHLLINSTTCLQDGSFDRLKQKCQNKTSCVIEANNDFGDPCQGTYKYTQLHYFCRKKEEYIQDCKTPGVENSFIEHFYDINQPGEIYSEPFAVIKGFSVRDFDNHSRPLLQKAGVHLETIPFQFTSPLVASLTVINTSQACTNSFIADRNALVSDPSFSHIFAIEGQPLVSIIVANLSSEIPFSVPVKFSVPVPTTSPNYVEAIFQQTNMGREVRYQRAKWLCVYVDPETKQFEQKGCQLVETSRKSRVTCACNHTTIFSVLLAVDAVILPPLIKELSYITIGTSVAFLFMTIVVLLSVRKAISSDRTFVQINLSLALLVFHCLNLTHDAVVAIPLACQAWSVALHYFLLSSVFWMLTEGITLAMKISSKSLQFFAIHPHKLNLGRCLLSWGIPTILVSVASVVGFFSPEPYLALNPLYESGLEAQQYQRCSLDYRSHLFYWALIGPICLCIAVNAVILIHVGVFTYRLNAHQPQAARPNADEEKEFERRMKEVASVAKLLLLLMPVMGLPLLMGLFVGIGSTESSWFFMYAHVIVNGLQGFSIFIIYCVTSKGVRDALKSCCSRPLCCNEQ